MISNFNLYADTFYYSRLLSFFFFFFQSFYGCCKIMYSFKLDLSPSYLFCIYRYHAIHKEVYEWFNISFDKFGRTSAPQQTEVCQAIFKKLMENNWLSENSMQQVCVIYCLYLVWFCTLLISLFFQAKKRSSLFLFSCPVIGFGVLLKSYWFWCLLFVLQLYFIVVKL